METTREYWGYGDDERGQSSNESSLMGRSAMPFLTDKNNPVGPALGQAALNLLLLLFFLLLFTTTVNITLVFVLWLLLFLLLYYYN